jgi:hypothetical protein
MCFILILQATAAKCLNTFGRKNSIKSSRPTDVEWGLTDNLPDQNPVSYTLRPPFEIHTGQE